MTTRRAVRKMKRIENLGKSASAGLSFVMIFRHKIDTSKFMSTSENLYGGTDLIERMKSEMICRARQFSGEWELVNFSYAFVPVGLDLD